MLYVRTRDRLIVAIDVRLSRTSLMLADFGGTQISLEPKGHPAVAPFTDALASDGIPFCVLGVADVQAEYERLTALGVTFTQPPTDMGPVIVAVLDDTVGNLLQLAQLVG